MNRMTAKQYRTLTKKKQQKEKKLSHRIASHIREQYPDVIHRFDVAADLKMSMYQAKAIRDDLLHEKGYPDIFIAEPKGKYHGLYIELKNGRSDVFKKDNTYKKSEHIDRQRMMHDRLRAKGYAVEWGLGFEETVKIIDLYMSIGAEKSNENQSTIYDYGA